VAFDKNSLMRTGINAAEKSGNDINDNVDSLKRAMDSLPRVIDSMRESLQKAGTALDSASKELRKLKP
jgi:ABC-type transporter Mla subunit MlaD